MDRYRISDYDTLPLFSKPKELLKCLPISEPTLYELINREGCPKIYIGNGKACILPTKKFIAWLEEQSMGV